MIPHQYPSQDPYFAEYLFIGLRERVQSANDVLLLSVRKGEWPTKAYAEPSLVSFSEIVQQESAVGTAVHKVELQHSALESADIAGGSPHAWTNAVDSLEENLVVFWRMRFESELDRLIKRRELANKFPISLWGHFPIVMSGPRTSLFGKKVYRFKFYKNRNILNRKYDRCPIQVMDFHPDIAEFMFLDLKEWAGKLVYCELFDNRFKVRRFLRAFLTSATKPLRSDVGRVTTILPKGLRGLLYRLVWQLLRIKP